MPSARSHSSAAVPLFAVLSVAALVLGGCGSRSNVAGRGGRHTPPDGGPIGPMALEVTCTPQVRGTVLQVRQSGWENAPRWSRYYEVLDPGFKAALEQLKARVESHATGPQTATTSRPTGA